MRDDREDEGRQSGGVPDERAKARARRRRLLTALQWGFGAIAVVYLALHAAVAWKAFTAVGFWWALLTLITLGFGDLWWAVDAARRGDMTMLVVAGVAAALAFASWSTRGYTNALMMRILGSELEDLNSELETLRETTDTDDTLR